MKLFLLKILLQRRARDEGFTLPMVIALGLVMLLLGTVNIVKSNEENITAINTNSSSDALAITEVGVARYRELLNQNRILTIYNHDQWDTNAAIVGANAAVTSDDRTCDDMNSAPPGWTGTATKPKDTAATATDDDDNWWNVSEDIDGDGIDETIGQYRLVSYIYDNDGNPADNDNGQFAPDDDNANTTDSFTYNNVDFPADPNGYNPRGILTVQARSIDERGNPNGSEAQIEVEIPLRINDLDNLAPALWIGSGNVSNLGNLVLPDGSDADTLSDTNIVVLGCSDPPDNGNNVIIGDPRNIPPIQPIANIITTAQSDNGDQTNDITNIDIPSDPSETIIIGFPASSSASTEKPYIMSSDGNSFVDYDNRDSTTGNWDCVDIRDCRYYYDLGATTINRNVETDGVTKATLYIDGNLTIDNADVGSSISSSYFEIYVTNSGNIIINTTSGATVEINAFIHAPDSTLTIIGSGNVKFNGSVWVNNFINNTTGTVTIDPDTTETSSSALERSYKFYTTTANRTPRPITGNPTNWVREEVQ